MIIIIIIIVFIIIIIIVIIIIIIISIIIIIISIIIIIIVIIIICISIIIIIIIITIIITNYCDLSYGYFQSVMVRMSRLTQADIVPSIDGLVNRPQLGFCHNFKVHTFSLPHGKCYYLDSPPSPWKIIISFWVNPLFMV